MSLYFTSILCTVSYLYRNSAYLKIVAHNLNVVCHSHVCSCTPTNIISIISHSQHAGIFILCPRATVYAFHPLQSLKAQLHSCHFVTTFYHNKLTHNISKYAATAFSFFYMNIALTKSHIPSNSPATQPLLSHCAITRHMH